LSAVNIPRNGRNPDVGTSITRVCPGGIDHELPYIDSRQHENPARGWPRTEQSVRACVCVYWGEGTRIWVIWVPRICHPHWPSKWFSLKKKQVEIGLPFSINQYRPIC